MNKLLHVAAMLTLSVAAILSFTACSKDDIENGTDLGSETWEVTGILSPNGLGDMNYNDKVFLGLCYMRDSLRCNVKTYSPSDFDDAEQEVNKWVSQKYKKNVHRLLVLCDSKYSDLVKKNCWKNQEGMDILQCDVSDTTLSVYTRATLLYGACYVVGRMNSEISSRTGKRTALMMANDVDWAISEGATGFREGCAEEGIDVDTYYLYDDESRGYNMPDSAYHLCYQIAPNTGFVMPLAGSSNNGVYRYGRDQRSDTIFSCMVDPYSYNATSYTPYYFTMDMPNLMLRFAQNWMNGTTQHMHSLAGISSRLVKIFLGGISTGDTELWEENPTYDRMQLIIEEAKKREQKRYADSNLEIDETNEF